MADSKAKSRLLAVINSADQTGAIMKAAVDHLKAGVNRREDKFWQKWEDGSLNPNSYSVDDKLMFFGMDKYQPSESIVLAHRIPALVGTYNFPSVEELKKTYRDTEYNRGQAYKEARRDKNLANLHAYQETLAHRITPTAPPLDASDAPPPGPVPHSGGRRSRKARAKGRRGRTRRVKKKAVHRSRRSKMNKRSRNKQSRSAMRKHRR